MSLNTDIWNTKITGLKIDSSAITNSKPKRVKVTIDGKDLGTASAVEITSTVYSEAGSSVDLKGLDGLADVSFYGHVYRGLRKTNKELEEEVAYWKNAWAGCDQHRNELSDEVRELNARGDADGDDVAYWHGRYVTAIEDAARRREEAEQLAEEVERLKQSRKEQTEKHKQKQANLQANFEQRASGEVRNTKLQAQLEQAKNYARALERDNKLLRSEQYSDIQHKLNTAVENAKHFAKHSDDLESQLKNEKASSAFWHEKYTESEEQIRGLVSKHDYLVDCVNGVSGLVNDAAERQGFDLE